MPGWPISPAASRCPSAPARTCFPSTTPATSNATAACGLDRDWLQFDISLGYGLPEYVRIVDCFAEKGWSPRRFAPHAGHVLALHTVAALGLGMAEVALDAALPIGGLPRGAPVKDGRVTLPDAPGFGIEEMPALHACFADLLA